MFLKSWPLPPEFTQVSQRFGENPKDYAPYGLAGHEGWDFPCPVGIPTFATHDGWIDPRWRGEYGDSVRVYNGEGSFTFHAHLSKTIGAYGQTAKAGQKIGETGSSGRSSGPHLHWAIQIKGISNPEYKNWLDPKDYLKRMIMSKLNPHFQQIPYWAKPLWANCKNEWYKIVLPPIGDPFPGKKGIGRPWIGTATESTEAVEGRYIRDGAAGAERYFERLSQYYLDRPYIWAWEGLNEPHPMGDAVFRAKLNEFLVRWVELMHGINKRTVILCLSVGWPDQPEDILDFVDALALTDYWALHEYSAPTMQDDAGWHCLRYRRTIQALKNWGLHVPPLLITECGIDGGVIGQARTGWRTHARDEEDFMGQLVWYDRELCQDDYVKAAFIFTSGPESDWLDFDVNETLTRKLVAHINTGGPLPVEPPPIDGPTDDEIRNLAWNSLGVPYTPMHAFPLYARKHNLGAPLRDTFDHKGVRIQPFMGAIIKCLIGSWDQVSHISW